MYGNAGTTAKPVIVGPQAVMVNRQRDVVAGDGVPLTFGFDAFFHSLPDCFTMV